MLGAISKNKIFNSSLEMLRDVPVDVMKTLIEELVCFSFDFIDFVMFDRTCLSWLYDISSCDEGTGHVPLYAAWQGSAEDSAEQINCLQQSF